MTDALPHPPVPTIAMLRTHSLSNVVQREIEQMILSGALPAGSRLNENALASKLSVSRGPVREACRALAELGFVELIPNRGAFVRRLDKVDAMEVYDLRAGLTGLAGSLLAPKITDHQIGQLEEQLNRMDRAADSAEFQAFNKLNLAFHDYIVEAAANTRLLKTYRGLVKEFQLFRNHGLMEPSALRASNEEHRAIIEMLRRRDSRGCYDASYHHVDRGKQRMLTALNNLAVSSASAGALENVASAT